MSLTTDEKKTLLQLARGGVAARVAGRPLPRVDTPEGVLAERRGCFVTLRNSGDLRGCIGTFRPESPLAEQIVQMGMAAASDPRFLYNAISSAELGQLTVEVSVLTPLEETDQPEKLRPGVDGVYLLGNGRGGCFLPEVASEAGWGAEDLLDQCCTMKAGLPRGAWKRPDVKVYLFQSENFSEADPDLQETSG
ncbi:MAG: AmmeMemoRadiSam system protein A [Planctomycetota bacterium]